MFECFLLQFPSGFDFLNHFGRFAGLFKGGLDEVSHQGFQVAKAKHFDYASAKVRMKEAVLPECVKGPIVNFKFRRIADIDNVAVWAGFKHWFSCVSSSGKDVESRFRGWTVH